MVEVGEHDFRELQLEQIDLFAQHERQQQVERAAEHVEVELKRAEAHGVACASSGARVLTRAP